MLFTYVQRKDATDLYYQIEYTDDLTNNLWNLLTDPQELTTTLDLGQVWQRTILVPPHFPNQKPAHEFLRLRLHQQTNLSQPIVLNDPPQQFTLKLQEPFSTSTCVGSTAATRKPATASNAALLVLAVGLLLVLQTHAPIPSTPPAP